MPLDDLWCLGSLHLGQNVKDQKVASTHPDQQFQLWSAWHSLTSLGVSGHILFFISCYSFLLQGISLRVVRLCLVSVSVGSLGCFSWCVVVMLCDINVNIYIYIEISIKNMPETCPAHIQQMFKTCPTHVLHKSNECQSHVQLMSITCPSKVQHVSLAKPTEML